MYFKHTMVWVDQVLDEVPHQKTEIFYLFIYFFGIVHTIGCNEDRVLHIICLVFQAQNCKAKTKNET